MKKIIVLLVVVLCAMIAVAQDAPKVEVFGGYQYTNVDLKGLSNRQSFNGWDADIAAHVAKNFSIVGDISGAYKSQTVSDATLGTATAKIRVYNYLFGPRVSASAGKVTPFAEALFGVTHATLGAEVTGVNANISSNGFGLALGGGLDVNANKHVAIRLAKFDYLMNQVKFSDLGVDEKLNNFRIATGIVFKF